MSLGPWFRFGLPIGHALLLVALLDIVILFMCVLKDTGILLVWPYTKDVDGIEKFNIVDITFASILIIFKLFSTIGFLWIGTIFNGNSRMLFAWNVTLIVSIIFVIVECIVQSITSFYGPHLYSLALFVITCLYQLIIGVESYISLKNQDHEAMRPIGKGVKFIWDYFNNERMAAVFFFLISELVIDTQILITRDFHNQIFGIDLGGHDASSYPPIVVEQLILKCIRILLNAIGLTLVYYEKRESFRLWCLVSFLLVLASTVIFVILTISWRGEDLFLTLAYFLAFPGHLLYRCIVLYFCLRFTRMDFSSMVL